MKNLHEHMLQQLMFQNRNHSGIKILIRERVIRLKRYLYREHNIICHSIGLAFSLYE